MNFTNNTAHEIIVKTSACKKETAVHPAEKSNKKSVYEKNYASKKSCQVKQCGRTLAN